MPNGTTLRNTLEQGRAQFAFTKANSVSKNKKKEYASYSKKLPMMIKTNGLGASLAFAWSKSEWRELYNHIEEWIRTDPKQLIHLEPGEKLVEKLTAVNSVDYRAVAVEVIAFLGWLRRFADGLKPE